MPSKSVRNTDYLTLMPEIRRPSYAGYSFPSRYQTNHEFLNLWQEPSKKINRNPRLIHNHMVVDYLSMSSVSFAIPDFCSLIPDMPSLSRQFSGRATLRLHYLRGSVPRVAPSK